jgi:hypothetical protein
MVIAGQLYIPVASAPTSQRISRITLLWERLGGPKWLSGYSSSEEKSHCLYRESNLGLLTRFGHCTNWATTKKLTRSSLEYPTLMSAESTQFTWRSNNLPTLYYSGLNFPEQHWSVAGF